MDEERKEECREEKQDNYEFLKETIKAKPIDKKKILKQIGRLAGAGAVFGLSAALVFSLVAPNILKKMQEKENASKVKFSQGKEQEEDSQRRNRRQKKNRKKKVRLLKTIVQEMTPQDYQKLYQDIFATVKEAEKSMVTVIGSQNDKDWFQTPYESQLFWFTGSRERAGLFYSYRIPYSGKRRQNTDCILRWNYDRRKIFKRRFQYGFCNFKSAKEGVPAETKEAIAIAPLGEAYYTKQGEPILAIGSPMGYSDSVGYGIVASTSNTVSRVDAEYNLLATDIPGSSQGSGVL